MASEKLAPSSWVHAEKPRWCHIPWCTATSVDNILERPLPVIHPREEPYSWWGRDLHPLAAFLHKWWCSCWRLPFPLQISFCWLWLVCRHACSSRWEPRTVHTALPGYLRLHRCHRNRLQTCAVESWDYLPRLLDDFHSYGRHQNPPAGRHANDWPKIVLRSFIKRWALTRGVLLVFDDIIWIMTK